MTASTIRDIFWSGKKGTSRRGRSPRTGLRAGQRQGPRKYFKIRGELLSIENKHGFVRKGRWTIQLQVDIGDAPTPAIEKQNRKLPKRGASLVTTHSCYPKKRGGRKNSASSKINPHQKENMELRGTKKWRRQKEKNCGEAGIPWKKAQS